MNRRLLPIAFAALALVALTACFRADTKDLCLRVPGMASARDLVLVTNAAQHELMGEYPAAKHFCEVDLPRALLVYYEGEALRDPVYVNRLLAALAQAGYPAEAHAVAASPSPPVLVGGVPRVFWPDCHRLVVRIPTMKRAIDANRVADALAYGRAGGRPERLLVDAAQRTVRVPAQNRRVSAAGNFAHALNSAGFEVEGWAGRPPEDDAPARGWFPFEG